MKKAKTVLFLLVCLAGLTIVGGKRMAKAVSLNVSDVLWGLAGNNIYNTNSGNVGIGTSGPMAKLDIKGGMALISENTLKTSFTSANTLILRNDPLIGQNYYPGLMLNSGYGGNDKPKAGIWFYGANDGTQIRFGTSNDSLTGITNTAMTIDKTGNVGIGTTNPSQKLEVNGGVRMNTATSKPNCDNSTRGLMWFVMGVGVSGKDAMQVCARDADGTISWLNLY